MRYSISATAFMALLGSAFAQVEGFDAITSPTDGEVLTPGSTYPINWEYSDAYNGTVTIQLLQGATPSTLEIGETIAAGVENSLKTYSWAVGSDVGGYATYGIKIIYDEDTTGATFQYSYPFQISDSGSDDSSSTTTPVSSALISSVVYSTTYPPTTATTVTPVTTSTLTTASAATTSDSSAAAETTTLPPVSAPTGGSNTTALTTFTSSKTSATGSAATASSTAVVTAGAARFAAGGLAVLGAAVFAL